MDRFRVLERVGSASGQRRLLHQQLEHCSVTGTPTPALRVGERRPTARSHLRERAWRARRLTARADAVLLQPVGGLLVLLAILFVMFQAVFAWARPLMDAIQ